MQIRTDLALEQTEMHPTLPKGIESREFTKGDAVITQITVLDSDGERALGKPKGKYITVEVPPFSDNTKTEELTKTVAENINNLILEKGTVLVVGLGNRDITPDALGPKTVSKILATRHLGKELIRSAGLTGVGSVAVMSPGVLGQTGIETFDQIKGICDRINPKTVIVIDALASRYLKRLGCTVQMSDSGIEPGAGVGNARFEISRKTLGIPVIAIGVPTVVEAATLVADLTGGESEISEPEGRQMIVTPREIDLLTERASLLLADAINLALHPDADPQILKEVL